MFIQIQITSCNILIVSIKALFLETLHAFLHKNSLIWESIDEIGIPWYLSLIFLSPLQNHSMFCVWVPSFGLTKLVEWFTVLWSKPIWLRCLYPDHMSVWILVLGLMCCLMTFSNVEAVLSGTLIAKHSFV